MAGEVGLGGGDLGGEGGVVLLQLVDHILLMERGGRTGRVILRMAMNQQHSQRSAHLNEGDDVGGASEAGEVCKGILAGERRELKVLVLDRQLPPQPKHDTVTRAFTPSSQGKNRRNCQSY